MIYLLLGEDRSAKDQKIDEVKAKHLPSHDAVKLDYEILHGVKLDPAALKKSLIALPAVAKKRFVLIRSAEKLNTQNKKIVLNFIQEENSHVVLMLDSDEDSPKNTFFGKVTSAAKVMRCGRKTAKRNVFDMTRAMEGRNPSGALKILHDLLGRGDHPLQIMGGLVWFWGKSKNRLSADGFKKGLLVLQEADLNIKRSRLKPEQAVEIAVTKLSSLIAC